MLKLQKELDRDMQFHKVYMNIACEIASLSRCNRRKVGAVIVLQDGSLIYGFNGTSKGTCNNCEDKSGVTKPEVIHAELNAIFKAEKSLNKSILYCTTEPCIRCASALIQKGISAVYYKDKYHTNEGIEYLNKYGVFTKQLC